MLDSTYILRILRTYWNWLCVHILIHVCSLRSVVVDIKSHWQGHLHPSPGRVPLLKLASMKQRRYLRRAMLTWSCYRVMLNVNLGSFNSVAYKRNSNTAFLHEFIVICRVKPWSQLLLKCLLLSSPIKQLPWFPGLFLREQSITLSKSILGLVLLSINQDMLRLLLLPLTQHHTPF